jgi:thiamine transporter
MNFLNDWSNRLTNYFTGFSEKSQTFINNPSLFIGLLGLAIVIFALFRFKNINLDTKIMSRIGISLALACALQVFRIYHFPAGGSVTLGGMVPILLIAFAYGPEIGMLTGFLYGLLNLFLDPYFIHPVQVLFDYPLPSLAIGLAGYFKNKPILGTSIAFLVKFVCHFISGVVFFSSDAISAGMHPLIYSLAVNGPMVAADAIICVALIAFLPFGALLKQAKA